MVRGEFTTVSAVSVRLTLEISVKADDIVRTKTTVEIVT